MHPFQGENGKCSCSSGAGKLAYQIPFVPARRDPERMTASEDSFCRSCTLRSSCRTGEPAAGPTISPGSLVAHAAAYFLLPLVAAIVAAAGASLPTGLQAGSAVAQVLAAGGGFVGAIAAVTVAARLLRARNDRRRPGAPGQMKV